VASCPATWCVRASRCCSPWAPLLVVGFIVGILQAATQINDPAVGFLPRLAAGLLVVFFLGGWIVERLAKYFIFSLERLSGGM
jgi:flagellar biosynthesis protein FliQ